MIYAIIVIAVLVLVPLFMYNNLIRKKNAVDNAFYSIDVMLRKRYDLIPQLVETVKGYMNYEKDILVQLTELRQKVTATGAGANDRVAIDNTINSLLGRLTVSFENYPQLKASRNFLRLQGAINEAEEQLAASRRFYNAAVTDYHNAIQSFPSSLLANAMGMKERNLFEITGEERKPVQINFS